MISKTPKILGYILGLVAVFLHLSMYHSVLPALLYLVPFTLIPVYIVSIIRGDFGAMWRGYTNVSWASICQSCNLPYLEFFIFHVHVPCNAFQLIVVAVVVVGGDDDIFCCSCSCCSSSFPFVSFPLWKEFKWKKISLAENLNGSLLLPIKHSIN